MSQKTNLPSDKLAITILGNIYETNASIGKFIDFSKNQAFYSSGMYSSITDSTTLDVIDIMSALYAFFPEIKKDTRVSNLLELKPNEFSSVIEEMDSKFFPWYSEWKKQFQSAKKVEKKETKTQGE